jgi:hypothetical protein
MSYCDVLNKPTFLNMKRIISIFVDTKLLSIVSNHINQE